MISSWCPAGPGRLQGHSHKGRRLTIHDTDYSASRSYFLLFWLRQNMCKIFKNLSSPYLQSLCCLSTLRQVNSPSSSSLSSVCVLKKRYTHPHPHTPTATNSTARSRVHKAAGASRTMINETTFHTQTLKKHTHESELRVIKFTHSPFIYDLLGVIFTKN